MDTIEFHKSTAKELIAIKDRVRNLVNHWGEDGRHQEAVIKTMIQRFLPEKFKIGSGFIVRQTRERGNHEPSKQIDLIIYDNSYPILFKDNDFVILTADSVLGIIEVKANATNQGLNDIIVKANENGKFIYDARYDNEKPLFNGIFSYESTVNNVNTIVNHIKNPWDGLGENRQFYAVNHISLNQDCFTNFGYTNLAMATCLIICIKLMNFHFHFLYLTLWTGLVGDQI